MVTSSLQITEVKQRRARLVLGWVTAARATMSAASVHPAVMGTWWNEKAKL